MTGQSGRLRFPARPARCLCKQAGIEDFATALAGFGQGRWRDFYEVAAQPEQIALTRPFYPARPGGRSRRQLIDGLRLETWHKLHRRCDGATAGRQAACPMFWTLGGNQVGKGMIVGWRDLLAPARRAGVEVVIWPFDGTLAKLMRSHRFVVTEAYPGEIYGHLGLSRCAPGRQRQPGRPAAAPEPAGLGAAGDVALAPALRADIGAGFGALRALMTVSMPWSACSG